MATEFFFRQKTWLESDGIWNVLPLFLLALLALLYSWALKSCFGNALVQAEWQMRPQTGKWNRASVEEKSRIVGRGLHSVQFSMRDRQCLQWQRWNETTWRWNEQLQGNRQSNRLFAFTRTVMFSLKRATPFRVCDLQIKLMNWHRPKWVACWESVRLPGQSPKGIVISWQPSALSALQVNQNKARKPCGAPVLQASAASRLRAPAPPQISRKKGVAEAGGAVEASDTGVAQCTCSHIVILCQCTWNKNSSQN